MIVLSLVYSCIVNNSSSSLKNIGQIILVPKVAMFLLSIGNGGCNFLSLNVCFGLVYRNYYNREFDKYFISKSRHWQQTRWSRKLLSRSLPTSISDFEKCDSFFLFIRCWRDCSFLICSPKIGLIMSFNHNAHVEWGQIIKISLLIE